MSQRTGFSLSTSDSAYWLICDGTRRGLSWHRADGHTLIGIEVAIRIARTRWHDGELYPLCFPCRGGYV